jgi:hypothetical protein
MRFYPGVCFYCRCEFTKPLKRGRYNAPQSNDPTEDHVYAFRVPLPPGLSSHYDKRNIVRACWSCNNRKGGMTPIQWLIICPDPAGAADLVALLLKLGAPQSGIDFALRTRERQNARPTA